MSYVKNTWVDDVSPISAARMNNIEVGIETVDIALADHLANTVSLTYGVNAAGTDTYTATISGVSAYTDGMPVILKATVANTTAATLNINGLGAKAIVRGTATALTTGDIPANKFILLVYNGTSFELMSQGADIYTQIATKLASSSYTAADVLAKLLTVDGSGSGLDADTVDGIDSDRMIYGDDSRGSTSWASGVDNIVKSGFYYVTTTTSLPIASNGHVEHIQHPGSNDYAKQIYNKVGTGEEYVRFKNAGTWGSWRAVGGVKVVQRGTVSINTNSTTNVTVSAVVMNKSVLELLNIFNEFDGGDSTSGSSNISMKLTSTTNIEITHSMARSPASITAIILSWEVTEHY